MLIIPEWVKRGDGFVLVNMIGHQIGGLGEPPPASGRRDTTTGEVLVDSAAGFHVGDSFGIAGRALRVVGLTSGRTYNGGTATAYLPIADAQTIALAGRPLISAVLIEGQPSTLPPGQELMTRSQVETSMLRGMRNGEKSIKNTRTLLWIVAIAIVAGVMYVAALERIRDFAVLKAIGARTRSLVTGLVAEAVILATVAAGLSIAMSRLMKGTMHGLPMALTAAAAELTVVVAIIVGAAASVAGVRRALRTDPALAFGGV
jgi:putative ABC transport system permease protein